MEDNTCKKRMISNALPLTPSQVEIEHAGEDDQHHSQSQCCIQQEINSG